MRRITVNSGSHFTWSCIRRKFHFLKVRSNSSEVFLQQGNRLHFRLLMRGSCRLPAVLYLKIRYHKIIESCPFCVWEPSTNSIQPGDSKCLLRRNALINFLCLHVLDSALKINKGPIRCDLYHRIKETFLSCRHDCGTEVIPFCSAIYNNVFYNSVYFDCLCYMLKHFTFFL